MMRAKGLAMVLVALSGAAVLGEMVTVPGSSTQYPTKIECNVAARPVKMVLTGAALRTNYLVNVYTIGSYVQEGVTVRSAEELAALDRPKQLHLILERNIDGKALADAFRAAIRLNYPEPAFADELHTLAQLLRSDSARKGDSIYLTHVPGVGLHCNRAGKVEYLIKSPNFARAVWDIYLGKKNLGESIKKGLVSRL